MPEETVLLIDWDNLAGAVINRGFRVSRDIIDALWGEALKVSGSRAPIAHIAAQRFEESIVRATEEHFIKREVVRGTKEQADIALTVLAMDYLHSGSRTFVLVTGDQDFVPLIARMHRENCHIIVVYGDSTRLSPELKAILEQPNIESRDISSFTALQTRKSSETDDATGFLALLELQRRGVILGGNDRGGRTQQLSAWGVLKSEEDTQYWELIDGLTVHVDRHNAAVKSDGSWIPRRARRTYLDQTPERLRIMTCADHLLREISSRGQGFRLEALRTGPLTDDDGVMLDRVTNALVQIQRIRRLPDGTFVAADESGQEGYLEYLWRVFALGLEKGYVSRTNTLPVGFLTPALSARGVGQGKEQRAASRVKAVEAYNRAFGTIDRVVVDGNVRWFVDHGNAACQRFIAGYRGFYELFPPESEDSEQQVVERMTEYDAGRIDPVFGWSMRDRHRLVRILSQSGLIRRRDGRITALRHPWGDDLRQKR